MDLELTNKAAVVTGGSKGIGKATAERLSQEGAVVWICARDGEVLAETAKEISEKTGNPVHHQVADVTDENSVKEFIERVAEHAGGIDILVNNAGRAQHGHFDDVTDDQWRADLDVKLFAHIRCCRAVIPPMKERGGGRIINMNAILGKQPSPDLIVTSVDRAACINFSKALSQELAPDKITVNSINLGLIESDQWIRLRDALAPDTPLQDFLDEMAKQKQIPLGRVGKAEEVAALVAFLASEPAAYITGASIEIDGGLSRYV